MYIILFDPSPSSIWERSLLLMPKFIGDHPLSLSPYITKSTGNSTTNSGSDHFASPSARTGQERGEDEGMVGMVPLQLDPEMAPLDWNVHGMSECHTQLRTRRLDVGLSLSSITTTTGTEHPSCYHKPY